MHTSFGIFHSTLSSSVSLLSYPCKVHTVLCWLVRLHPNETAIATAAPGTINCTPKCDGCLHS